MTATNIVAEPTTGGFHISSDNVESFLATNGQMSPEELKELGNKLMNNSADDAILVYKKALKKALSRAYNTARDEHVNVTTSSSTSAVTGGTEELALSDDFHSSMVETTSLIESLRLNLSLAFMKTEDWLMAKEHLLSVLNVNPKHPKALLRLVNVYAFGLHDIDTAIGICDKVFADNTFFDHESAASYISDFQNMKNSIIQHYNLNADGTFKKYSQSGVQAMGKNFLRDNRSREEIAKSVATVDPSTIKDGVKRVDLSTATSVADYKQLIEKVIRLHLNEFDDLVDPTSNWLKCLSENDVDERYPLYMSLPMTVLWGLTELITESLGISKMSQRSEYPSQFALQSIKSLPTEKQIPLLTSFEASKAHYQTEMSQNEELKTLLEFTDGVPPVTRKPLDSMLAIELLHQLTRVSPVDGEGTRYDHLNPFTIHVVGATDAMMETRWSALLERLPALDCLQVINIGFNTSDTVVGRTGVVTDKANKGDKKSEVLQYDYLSPPLTKSLPSLQKVLMHFYRGTYSDFVRSDAVKKALRKGCLANNNVSDLFNSAYAPHLIINLTDYSLNFNESVYAAALGGMKRIPVLMIEQNTLMEPKVTGGDGHLFNSLDNTTYIAKRLGLTNTPVIHSPYMIAVEPSDDVPPMIADYVNVITDEAGTGLASAAYEYSGISSRYGRLSIVYTSDNGVLCTPVITDAYQNGPLCDSILKLKADLSAVMDVNSMERAIGLIDGDQFDAAMKEVSADWEALVEEKSKAVLETLNGKMKK